MATLSTTVQPYPHDLPGLTREGDVLLYRDVPVRELHAFPVTLAAILCAISLPTIREDLKTGRLQRTVHGLISRAELERYLGDPSAPGQNGPKLGQTDRAMRTDGPQVLAQRSNNARS